MSDWLLAAHHDAKGKMEMGWPGWPSETLRRCWSTTESPRVRWLSYKAPGVGSAFELWRKPSRITVLVDSCAARIRVADQNVFQREMG